MSAAEFTRARKAPVMAVRNGTPRSAVPDTLPPWRWASRKATAEHLKISERTVTEMVSDGRIVAYRLGGTVRFDLAEVDRAFVPTGAAVGRREVS